MKLGVHTSIAGGVSNAILQAVRLSINTMQIFSRSPRGGSAPPISKETADKFDNDRRMHGIDPVAVHSPYIINLASPDKRMWAQSLRLYKEEYKRCTDLNIEYIVTHVGSHRGTGEEGGIIRVAEALNQTLDSIDSNVMILLENTAGSGQGLGDKFSHLRDMRELVESSEKVGVCLDTAHTFAAGYPIHEPGGLKKTIDEFEREVGLSTLKLIHLNDSKVPFESRVDRHWHIGEGHIGLEAFRRVVNHPKLADVPMILETPKKSDAEDLANLRTVRSIRKSILEND